MGLTHKTLSINITLHSYLLLLINCSDIVIAFTNLEYTFFFMNCKPFIILSEAVEPDILLEL